MEFLELCEQCPQGWFVHGGLEESGHAVAVLLKAFGL